MSDLSERVLTVKETAVFLGIGLRTAYGGIHRGEIPALRIGRRIVVPGAALERYIWQHLDYPAIAKSLDTDEPSQGGSEGRE